jgi:hypothetical protein
LRAVAIELEAVQRLEGEGAIDPVGGVLAEIEDDMNRPAGLGRITGRFGNRGQRLGKGGIRIANRRPGNSPCRKRSRLCRTQAAPGLRCRAGGPSPGTKRRA